MPGVCLAWLLACVLAVVTPNARAQFGQVVVFTSPGNTTYYLDAETGSDENPGTQPETAWQTLARVNSTQFAPGDTILIKAGTEYHGQLWPKGTGTPGGPIRIDAYGDGEKPVIHGGGEHAQTLLLENQSSWHIYNLELTNTGDKPEVFRYGINIIAEDFANAGDIKLVNLLVRDVNGTTKPGIGRGAGIVLRSQAAVTPTRYDGILIEGCTVRNCAREGIAIENSATDRRSWLAHQNVIIRENTVENVQGDGLRLTGCEDAIVEYNHIDSAGLAEDGLAGGIHASSSDNCLIQYNVVCNTKGRDNAALRCGVNSRDNTFQFNYTADNAGPLMGITTPVVNGQPQAAQGQTPNLNTAVRYNISQNDSGGLRVTGPTQDATFHNNTVYGPAETQAVSIALIDQGGQPANTTIANNLFYTEGQATLDLAAETKATFQTNAYFGEHDLPEAEQDPITADPLLVEPGCGKLSRDGLEGYQTQEGSPLIDAGTRLPSHGSHDFWARPVPGGKTVDVGAFQTTPDEASDKLKTPVTTPESP